jgi:hypothetical protein
MNTWYEVQTRNDDGTWSYYTTDWDLTDAPVVAPSEVELRCDLAFWLVDNDETEGSWALSWHRQDGLTYSGVVDMSGE